MIFLLILALTANKLLQQNWTRLMERNTTWAADARRKISRWTLSDRHLNSLRIRDFSDVQSFSHLE